MGGRGKLTVERVLSRLCVELSLITGVGDVTRGVGNPIACFASGGQNLEMLVLTCELLALLSIHAGEVLVELVGQVVVSCVHGDIHCRSGVSGCVCWWVS